MSSFSRTFLGRVLVDPPLSSCLLLTRYEGISGFPSKAQPARTIARAVAEYFTREGADEATHRQVQVLALRRPNAMHLIEIVVDGLLNERRKDDPQWDDGDDGK